MKMNSIKRYKCHAIASVFSVVLWGSGCVGQIEPELPASNELVVVTDIPYVNVDNHESVTFRATLDGELLPKSDVDIILIEESGDETQLAGATYVPSAVGSYRFKAAYNDAVSEEELVVTAYNNSQITSTFFPRHIIHKFTATWCANCPAMGESIHEVSEAQPLRVIEVATHCYELTGASELEVAEGKQLDALFGIGGTYPTIVLDYDVSTKTTSANTTSLANAIASNEANYPTVSGVKIASALDGLELSVSVSATVQETNDYRIGVLLVQDNYFFTQYGATSDYKQNYVLRGYLTDIEGDELGALSANSETTRTYTTQVEESALSAECRIVAFLYNKTSDGSYVVNNATQCIIGGSVEYLYEFK